MVCAHQKPYTRKINGWNLRIRAPWKRKIIWTKPSFSGSILNFSGFLNHQQYLHSYRNHWKGHQLPYLSLTVWGIWIFVPWRKLIFRFDSFNFGDGGMELNWPMSSPRNSSSKRFGDHRSCYRKSSVWLVKRDMSWWKIFEWNSCGFLFCECHLWWDFF